MSNKKIKLIVPFKLKVFLVLIFVLLFTSYSKIFALGGTGPFAPGTELDPGCAPGDVNCIVFLNNISLTSQISGFVSNSGIVTSSDTLINALGKLDANINSKVSSQWVSSSNDIYYNSGRVWIGANSESTSSSSLFISGTTSSSGSSSAISGILGSYTFNPTLGGVQVGNRYVINNMPTSSSNTAVGSIYRIVDNTSLSNLVRGLDVTSNSGTNTFGVNTGLRANGATFGLQGVTTALAGSVYVPAAIYGESTGTTQGDVLRLYSNTMTTAPAYATFYHDTSSYSGTGLLLDFATGSGVFTGNFVDFQNNNNSLFKVTSDGFLSMGLPSATATSAVCSSLSNGTNPVLGVSYEIRDCSSTPVADYAEMYPVDDGITYGDIVALGGDIVETYDVDEYGVIDFNTVKGKINKLVKSNEEYQEKVVGIVSKNYGDFSSVGYNIKKIDNPMPVALNGRVSVKISSSSDLIQAGDYLTTSKEEGKATKATKSGFVIGKALEDWDGKSDTIMVFVEQGYHQMHSQGLYVENLFNEDGEIIQSEGVGFLNTILNGVVEFSDKIFFNKMVIFNTAPVFSKDTAGYALIKQEEKEVRVDFENTYSEIPVVNVSIDTNVFLDEDVNFIIKDKDETGFTISLQNEASSDINFSWIAIAVKEPKTFENIPELPTPFIPNTETTSASGTSQSQ